MNYKEECKLALKIQEETSIYKIACQLAGLANIKHIVVLSIGEPQYETLIKAYLNRLAELACGHSHYESSFKDALKCVKEESV